MPIPTHQEIEIPLLHLINSAGGEIKPKDAYVPLADYFKLTRQEREQLLPNTPYRKFENRVHWARLRLVHKGFLDKSVHGIWKITEKGKKKLAEYGLLNKPFPNTFIQQKPSEIELTQEQSDLVSQAINELLADGIKKFPEDFLDCKETRFQEITVPGTILQLDRYYKDTIVSPKGYFRYKAKNPSEALYILYSNHLGQKTIKIPADNLIVFKTVKSYEKYIRNLQSKLFEKFLELTSDETKSEVLTNNALEKLDLKVRGENHGE
ncbi:MAG: winged helix-turn-helix domain-containing protein [Candidatus Omnitrophica bacterium]|nr:winged helix-turn-helix domain-containing protein [Candidatus Omnitrophota bacterium]